MGSSTVIPCESAALFTLLLTLWLMAGLPTLPSTPASPQGAIQQFVGSSSVASRPSDGLKTWQRTVLADMGLLHTQQEHQQQQKQQQQEGVVQRQEGEPVREGDQAAAAVVVSIGGDPPVRGPLLAACRVMLAEVRGDGPGGSVLKKIGMEVFRHL